MAQTPEQKLRPGYTKAVGWKYDIQTDQFVAPNGDRFPPKKAAKRV